MAKKKGGSKKKRTSSKSKKKGAPKSKARQKAKKEEPVVAPEPVEELPPPPPPPEPEEPDIKDVTGIEDATDIEDITDTEGVTEIEPEEEESKLSDAVSAVIGDDDAKPKSKEKKSPTQQKREKLILQWTAEGYNVDHLEDLLASGVKKGVKKAFDDFEKGISRIEEIKEELDGANIADVEAEYNDLTAMLSSPGDIGNIETAFVNLKARIKAKELEKELDGMKLPQFKDQIDEIREMLADPDRVDEAEKAIEDFKKGYKEAYFEDSVASLVTGPETAKPKAAKPTAPRPGAVKTPMTVRDIFLLYRNGKFISHHTGRVVPKEEQEQLFADLKTGRNYLKSPNYKPKKLNVISVNNRKILVQGGLFTVVVIIAEGEVNPWTEKIVGKVLGLMEKEDRVPLQNWNGDVASLKSAGKYMTALLYATMKLGKKAD